MLLFLQPSVKYNSVKVRSSQILKYVYYFCLSSIVSSFSYALPLTFDPASTLKTTQDRQLWVTSLVLISSLSFFFSPVNICDWAFWTGLISHLRALMGAECNWRVNCVTFTPQIFDLCPTFMWGGMMWNSIPHTHIVHTPQHLSWWLIRS